jgi:hypothetical protein
MRRSSRVLIAGLVLIALGLGNWIMGLDKTQRYARRMKVAVAREGAAAAIPFSGTTTILEEYTAAREIHADSLVKYEYYRVLHRGGILLLVIGVLLSSGAVVRLIVVPGPPRTASNRR